MSIVFGVRGNSFTARYANGAEEGRLVGASPPAVAVDATALSGSVLQFRPTGSSTVMSFAHWPGFRNLFDGRTFSVLLRFKPKYSGSPAAARPYFMIGHIKTPVYSPLHLDSWHVATTGEIFAYAHNQVGTNILNHSSVAWAPSADTYYDFLWTYNGDGSANGYKQYINGVLNRQVSPSALSASLTSADWPSIFLGAVYATPSSDMDVDEFVIWNEIIDPANVALVGGNGALDGAARVALVDVEAFNGMDYLALAATTKVGVEASDGTGIYDGTDRHTDPGVANVAAGVEYKSNSLTNNRTGTLTASTDPGVANVKLATAYNINGVAKVGTMVNTDPGVSNVRNNVEYEIESVEKVGTWGAVTGDGMVADLKEGLDDILAIRDEIGAVKAECYIVNWAWSGAEPGDGVQTETKVQLLPSPHIVEYKDDLRIVAGGAVQQGDIKLKMISKQSYPDKVDVDLSDATATNEKFYEVGGQLFTVVEVYESYLTWDVLLRPKTDQQRPA